MLTWSGKLYTGNIGLFNGKPVISVFFNGVPVNPAFLNGNPLDTLLWAYERVE